MAYHSDEEPVTFSPTPAYPRGGNRAGSHIEATKAPKMNLLQKENDKLVAQLKEAMEEIATLKSRAPTSQEEGEENGSQRRRRDSGRMWAPSDVVSGRKMPTAAKSRSWSQRTLT